MEVKALNLSSKVLVLLFGGCCGGQRPFGVFLLNQFIPIQNEFCYLGFTGGGELGQPLRFGVGESLARSWPCAPQPPSLGAAGAARVVVRVAPLSLRKRDNQEQSLENLMEELETGEHLGCG